MSHFEHEIERGRMFLDNLESWFQRKDIKDLAKWQRMYYELDTEFRDYKKKAKEKIEAAELKTAQTGLRYARLLNRLNKSSKGELVHISKLLPTIEELSE